MPFVREDFDDLRFWRSRVELCEERIARLRSAMEGGQRVLRTLPGKTSARGSVLLRQMAQLEKLEADLVACTAEYEFRAQRLNGALAALPEPQRTVMELRYVQGLRWREVAGRTHFSERWCRKMHSKALEVVGFYGKI